MSRYYSPEGGFTIQIQLWIQNFIVLIKCLVLKSFQEPSTILFNSFGFFVILCSLNGLQTITTVETMNFRILCFITILQPFLG